MSKIHVAELAESHESIIYISPSLTWARDRADKNPAAVALGKLGGATTSEAKSAAARANGARGGRPKTGAKIAEN